MRANSPLSTFHDELDRWGEAGHVARFWLRDDDAHEPTRALDELLSRVRAHASGCMLAVIPMRAGEALAGRLAGEAAVTVAMHGAWHRNHAPEGRKSTETPIERGIGTILTELANARRRLTEQFGPQAGDWYVPPWNRLDGDVAARLPELGFRAVSTFAGNLFHLGPTLEQVNTHVDVMDWKAGRIGRSAEAVAADLAAQLAIARSNGRTSTGLLTHHLVHDDTAWSTLDLVFDIISRHPAAAWIAPGELLSRCGRRDGQVTDPLEDA